MSEQDKADLRLSLARLRQDHADSDAAIDAMMKTGCDPLQIQRMKKKKLTIKDQLTRLEDQIIPDIIPRLAGVAAARPIAHSSRDRAPARSKH